MTAAIVSLLNWWSWARNCGETWILAGRSNDDNWIGDLSAARATDGDCPLDGEEFKICSRLEMFF